MRFVWKDLPIDAFRNTQLFLEIIDCSPLLKQVIARATDWQTDRRYSSIQAFYDDVTSAREHRSVNAPALAI